MHEKAQISNKNSKKEVASQMNYKKENGNSGRKMAAAAGGVVLGNLAWGMAKEVKELSAEIIEQYLVGANEVDANEIISDETIENPEVEAVLTDEDSIIPDGGIEPAEVSTMVNDEMSFDEAFAEARQELGAGGVFEWNGNVYGTYYKEEWEDLSSEETQDYWASVEAAEVDIEQEVLPDDYILDEMYAETVDLDGDGYEESVAIDSNMEGEFDVIATDSNMDGELDMAVADNNHDGKMDVFVQDTDRDGEFDHTESIVNDKLMTDNSDVDSDLSSDFDNNSDMSEWA